MERDVAVSARALADLEEILDIVSDRAGPATARRYVGRIYDRCRRIGQVPEQGTQKPGLGPSVSLIGFERRLAILFRIEPARVLVLRVLYGGRDLGTALGRDTA